MPVSRRELCALLPAVLTPAALLPVLLPAEAAATEDPKILPSAMYPFEKLSPHASGTAVIREVLKGKLATGESLEVHQTTLPPSAMPHPPHHHAHSELWLIREGTVELTVEGNSTKMGAGSVGFVHSNDEHSIRNVGTIPATYFVVEIGASAIGG
jgi:mannose-6-phosphate isomerase-like protein (cupin superfamily)